MILFQKSKCIINTVFLTTILTHYYLDQFAIRTNLINTLFHFFNNWTRDCSIKVSNTCMITYHFARLCKPLRNDCKQKFCAWMFHQFILVQLATWLLNLIIGFGCWTKLRLLELVKVFEAVPYERKINLSCIFVCVQPLDFCSACLV